MSVNPRLTAAVAACVALGLTAAAPAAFATTRSTSPPGGGGDSGCTVPYQLTNTCSGGFQGVVTVANTGTAAIAGWRVTWTDPGGTAITSLWNGRWTVVDGANVVLNEAYNGQLAAWSSTELFRVTL